MSQKVEGCPGCSSQDLQPQRGRDPEPVSAALPTGLPLAPARGCLEPSWPQKQAVSVLG